MILFATLVGANKMRSLIIIVVVAVVVYYITKNRPDMLAKVGL